MRTTLNVDDGLFEELLKLTKAKTKTEAVRLALGEFIRLKRKEMLLAARGTFDISDDWKKLRALETADE